MQQEEEGAHPGAPGTALLFTAEPPALRSGSSTPGAQGCPTLTFRAISPPLGSGDPLPELLGVPSSEMYILGTIAYLLKSEI